MKELKTKGVDHIGKRLLGLSLVSAVSAGLLATSVVRAEETLQLEEIVVTARKTDEKLQDIPVTLTALTSATIEKLQIKNIFDLATVTPGVYFGTTGGRNGGNKLQIRNFSTGTAGPSKASVFIDGVYMAGDYASIPMANLERIEVMKGPQSAYFGRATLVGGVNFVTRDPGNEFTGKAEVVAATLGEHDVSGYVSIPIIQDVLSQQFTVRDYSFKGPNEWRTTDGYHLGDQSTRAFSSKTIIKPNENLTFKINYNHVKDDDHIPPVLYADFNDRTAITRADGSKGYYFNGPVNYKFATPSWGMPTTGFDNPGIRHTQDQIHFHYDMKVGDATVSGFIAHNSEQFEEQLDGSFYLSGTSPSTALNSAGVPTAVSWATNFGFANFLLKDQDDQFEFRVTSSPDKAIRYMFGFNHSQIKGSAQLFSAITKAPTFWSNAYGGSFLNPATDDSVFGGLYWDVTQAITLTAEARYQREQIEAKNYSVTPATLGTVTSDATANFYAFLPRLNIQYKVNDRLNFYGIYSEGNNPGGFQPITPAQAASVGVPYAFKEEKVTNYEAGMKSTWLNGKLTVNAAIFHMDFKNEQLSQTTLVAGTPSGFASIYQPDVSSKVDGFEVEVNTIVTNDLQLRGTVGYGKAVYKNFCSSPYAYLTGVANDPKGITFCRVVNGKQQEGTPALQTSLSADYMHELGGSWSLFVRPDWEYQSKVYNEEWDQSWIPAHSMFNLRAGVQNGSWEFEGFVKNLGDDKNTTRSTRVTDGRIGAAAGSYAPYILNGISISQTLAGQQTVAGTAKKPRQYGVRVAYKF